MYTICIYIYIYISITYFIRLYDAIIQFRVDPACQLSLACIARRAVNKKKQEKLKEYNKNMKNIK